jgi:hypothetical protein
VGERLHIFGKTRAAEAQPRLQKRMSNPLVVAHRFGNLHDIGACALA